MPHASYATSSIGITRARWMLWGGVALGAGILAIFANLVVQMLTGRMTLLGISSLFLVLLAAPGVSLAFNGGFRLRAEARVRALAAANPTAFLLHLVLPRNISSGWKAAALALHMPYRRFPIFAGYAVLVADSQTIRVFVGGAHPRECIAIPTARLTAARVQSAMFGVRQLTYLHLEVTDDGGRAWPIKVLPVAWPGVVAKPVPDAAFPAELEAMRYSTHPGA